MSADCPQGKDCDDSNADIFPGAVETCDDAVDDDCDGLDLICCLDKDGDGYGEGPQCLGLDCNDKDINSYPGAEEICGDGKDQDCFAGDIECPPSPCTEESDIDKDGFGSATGCDPMDCDDYNKKVFPGADEVCGDGIDQNCDGVDALCPDSDCIDKDGDGYGEGADCYGEDCNDANPAVNPGVTNDACEDGVDQDCDSVDPVCPSECVDEDQDGHFAIADNCPEGDDCKDDDNTIAPGAEEICGDGVDQNCDSQDLECPDTGCKGNEDCNEGESCKVATGECVVLDPREWWAPIIYLDTYSGKPGYDFFTTFNYDGDDIAANNGDNVENSTHLKTARAYSSIVATATHWYIGYHFYFPVRYSATGTNNLYENAMRSVLLVIRKDDNFGTLELMETTGEYTFSQYVREGSSLSGGSQTEEGIITMDDSGDHERPVIFVQRGTHEITGKESWDLNGGQFPENNGVIFKWGFEGEVPTGLVGSFSYDLLKLDETLWLNREDIGDTKTFDEFGRFARDMGTASAPPSLVPWSYREVNDTSRPWGEFLFDPASMVRRHFEGGWGTFQTIYEYNPFAIRVDLKSVTIKYDADPTWGSGESDPFINLYMVDGSGTERRVLGASDGLHNSWKEKDIDVGETINLQDALGRYWFYGLLHPEAEAVGIEVREDDLALDDWLMDTEKRSYHTYTGEQTLDFGKSEVTMGIYIQ